MALPPPMAFQAVPFDPPILVDARRDVPIQVLNEDGTITDEVAFLMEDSRNPLRCYKRWPRRAIIIARGEVLLCQVLTRHHSTITLASDGDEQREDAEIRPLLFIPTEHTVAVKMLHRNEIGEGSQEDPYIELSVMQQYGDGQHVVDCYDALEDADHLYIVTLYAPQGDMFEHIDFIGTLGRGYHPREDIPTIVRTLIENLLYLQQHNLVHRDLKPENILFYSPTRLPFLDFAMTRRVALLEGQPQLLVNNGPAGSPSYWSPEVCNGDDYGFQADVWALGSIVWNMLTGTRFCFFPRNTDISYWFFVTLGGIHNEDLCDYMMERIMYEHQQQQQQQQGQAGIGGLFELLQAVQALMPVERDFLRRILQKDPDDRPSLQDLLQHPFL